MKDNMYVDNILSGADTELRASQYYDESRSIMTEAKFNLRSWASNSPTLQQKATNDGTIDTTPATDINVLGLRWNTSSDTIHFATKKPLPNNHELITKREVLQLSSSIFDPLGIIAPVTVRAKIFIQQLWQQSIDWDEPLNEQLQQEWLKLVVDLFAAQQTIIPRRYHLTPPVSQNSAQLHVFVDASKLAYGAVAYLQQHSQVAFVMAKTRVAPIKTLTIPQLELMAALIGARLASFIHNAIKNRYNALEVHLWSDSQIVLHWLSSNKQLKQFIANRVRSIKDLFPSNIWHYCPTNENPADVLTRGFTTTQMHSSKLWNNGPSWLTLPAVNWPAWTPTTTLLVEADQQVLENEPIQMEDPSTLSFSSDTGIHNVIDISRYSSLTTLIHVTAYVLRFINSLIKRTPKRTGTLTVNEINTAENLWIQCCQHTTYPAELVNLTTKNSSRLLLVKQLRLFLDQHHIIRCGGRIHNAPINQSAKFPILLPVDHPFTTLIIHSIHTTQLHSGVNSTLTALRDRFWIPRARQVIKKLLRKCVVCRKQNGKPYTIPDPAPLPKWRVQDSTPFSVTGVDFTGALFVKTPTKEEKVYICLFTCAATRALHLEVVEDLSEETFLKAFRRFASRKSLPQKMVSDNGSTYLSAAEELKRLFQSISLKEAFNRRGVDWQFIPKRAPWYGGFWERLIGLTKTVLKKVLGRTHVTLSSLQTIIVEIEAVLNDRPLTHVSSDIEDEEPLTPSHLLYGRRITSLPHPIVEDDEIDDPTFGNISEITKRAQIQALILQHFWSRWKAEYLTSLREFHKTTGKNNQTIRVGEVVLIHDDSPRIKWKLAVIEDLITGNDGLIRAANLRTSTGQTNRPIAKLYPLEVRADIMSKTEHKSEGVPPQRPEIRSKRTAANNALKKISEWTNMLNTSPPGGCHGLLH
jgi:transposase InsO family protein